MILKFKTVWERVGGGKSSYSTTKSDDDRMADNRLTRHSWRAKGMMGDTDVISKTKTTSRGQNGGQSKTKFCRHSYIESPDFNE